MDEEVIVCLRLGDTTSSRDSATRLGEATVRCEPTVPMSGDCEKAHGHENLPRTLGHEEDADAEDERPEQTNTNHGTP